MKNNISDIIMNPVRQRIIQYLLIHKTGTVAEISASLNDIPKPSLYRHINALKDCNCIHCVNETAIRGTTLKTYALTSNPLGDTDASTIINGALMSISASFLSYFENEQANPEKDMLCLSSCTLMLSDDEIKELLMRIGQVYSDYIDNKPSQERKPRCLTIISSPTQINTRSDTNA